MSRTLAWLAVPLWLALAAVSSAANAVEAPPFELRHGDRVVLIGSTLV
ncbi:MAG: hypothetical protein JNG90_10715, partial [Planctomycetaceae bacterium]|nr:hypothetical protein [Planctomycetaceae bacterium]